MIHQSKRNKLIHLGVNLFVIVLVIFVAIQAINAYNGKFEKQYDFTPPRISNDEFIGGIEKNLNLKFNVSLDHNVVFHTTSLSAQNPIDVEVWVTPSPKFQNTVPNQWETMPEYMTIIFSNAVNYDESMKINQKDLAMIKLDRQSEPKQYYGKGKIMYQFEGEYGYFFMIPSTMDKFTQDNFMYLSNSFIENKTQGNPPFYIGGSDQTVNLKQNDIFISLTLVFVIFAIIESRSHIVSGFMWIFGDKEKQNNT